MNDLSVLIASFVTTEVEVEVVRISDPNIDTLYLTSQLGSGVTIKDENGIEREVIYVPMSLSDEASGQLLLNQRTLTLQSINDLVATEEDKIPVDYTGKVKVDVMTYIQSTSGELTDIAQGPIRYFLQKTSYSQKNNTATLTISTSPTNKSETGVRATNSLFPTLAGFQ